MISLLKLFLTFFKIGLFTVGGGYAMIPFVRKEAVEIHGWISEQMFSEIIALDTVTPGPIAVNMATFVGYKVNGIPGAIIATMGVVLPSLILVTLIAAVFYMFKENRIVQAIIKGLKPAVIALIAVAIVHLLQAKAVFDIKSAVIAVVVFVGVLVFKIHPLWLVSLSALAGYILYLK